MSAPTQKTRSWAVAIWLIVGLLSAIVALQSVTLWSVISLRQPSATSWEYRYGYIERQERIDEMRDEGWEMMNVHAHPNGQLYMMARRRR